MDMKKLKVFKGAEKNDGCTVVVKAIKPNARVATVVTPEPTVLHLTCEEQDLIADKYRKRFWTKKDVTIGIWAQEFLNA